MLRPESSKPIDLVPAVLACALAATIVCSAAFSLGLPEKGKSELILLSALWGFLLLLPISAFFVVPSYFLLRRFGRLGLVPFIVIGVAGALSIAFVLPIHGGEAYITLAFIGAVGALASHGTLAHLSRRRAIHANRFDA